MNRSSLALFLAFATVGYCSVAKGQYARLTYQSDPGDWIGKGVEDDIYFTESNSYIFRTRLSDPLPTGEPMSVSLQFLLIEHLRFASIDFSSAGLGVPLQPGAFSNAIRPDQFVNAPGMSIAIDGAGCNTLTGNFTIQAIEFGEPGFFGEPTLKKLSATFEQRCDGSSAAIRGSLVFNAVPEPSAGVLACITLLGVHFTARSRREG